MFLSRNRENNVYPYNYIIVGFKGVKNVFVMPAFTFATMLQVGFCSTKYMALDKLLFFFQPKCVFLFLQGNIVEGTQ